MRTITEFKKISVTKEIYDCLHEDKKKFQDTIGGGRWSVSDVINEYLKIIGLNDERR